MRRVSALVRTPRSIVPESRRIPNHKYLITRVGTIADALLAALLAPGCAVCSAQLEQPTQGCVCRNCWASIRPITPPICDRCGDPLPGSEARCMNCSEHASAVTRGPVPLVEYEGTLREVIHALKYSSRHSLARPLAERMRQRGRQLIEEVDCVVPVPLHWRREYQRGFNQAREIARHLGPPVADVLIRRRATRAQVELAADRRRANVDGAFGVRRRWFRGQRFEERRCC